MALDIAQAYVDLCREILYNVIREIYCPCSRCRRRSGEINRLENILVNTKAADDKLAALIFERILD